jgi:hypothetical protein
VHRVRKGRRLVEFSGVDGRSGTVLVTLLTTSSAACSVVGWGGMKLIIEVCCFKANPRRPVDAVFSLSYLK